MYQILPYKAIRDFGDKLAETFNFPYCFNAVCDLNGKLFYTNWVNGTSAHLGTFILALIQALIDNNEADDDLLKAYTLMRRYVKHRGGSVRPATGEDFNETIE